MFSDKQPLSKPILRSTPLFPPILSIQYYNKVRTPQFFTLTPPPQKLISSYGLVSTETFAILKAIDIANKFHFDNIAVLNDFLSSIAALSNDNSTNELITSIQVLIQSSKKYNFNLNPSPRRYPGKRKGRQSCA